MSPFAKYILGPEAYWVLLCVLMKLVGLRNVPATEAGSRWLEQFWNWLPFVAVPLTFLALFTPGLSRGWLILRVVLAAAVGVCLAAWIVTGHIDYKDSRNSGVPTGWIMATFFGWTMAAVCAGITGLVLWIRSRA